jgi:hypothetical protein
VVRVVVGKKISVKENPTPYRIIWRCVPSRNRRRIVSSRCTASAATLRSMVGWRAGAEKGEGKHG